MTWTYIGATVEWTVLAWFFSILAVIVIQVIRGRILIAGMLGGSSGVRIHRLQLLLVTLVFAGGYLARALAVAPGESLPDVPGALLVGILGSQGAYLGFKMHQLSGAGGTT
jgi:hypothetical protein